MDERQGGDQPDIPVTLFYLNSPTPLNADFFYLNSLRRVLFYGVNDV